MAIQTKDNKRIFEVWTEGFKEPKFSGKAKFYGEYKVKSFKDACYLAFIRSLNYFDSEKLTFWSRHLFDNEEDARKSFG